MGAICHPKADNADAATKEARSKGKVSSWDMSQSDTALSIGESPLALGVALQVSIDPTNSLSGIGDIATMPAIVLSGETRFPVSSFVLYPLGADDDVSCGS
jgi:hypothetical protein